MWLSIFLRFIRNVSQISFKRQKFCGSPKRSASSLLISSQCIENMKTSENQRFRNSHCKCSIRKGIIKNFAIFTGKHLRWSLVSKSCRTGGLKLYQKEIPTLLKRDSNTSVFLWMNIAKFWKSSVNGCF